MDAYPITDPNLQPHEIIDGKIHIYYSERLTTDELTQILRPLIKNKEYNWIVIGPSKYSMPIEDATNKLCNDILEKTKFEHVTQINMNSEDEDAEKHKVLNAVLNAIPRLKLQNDDDIDNFKFIEQNEYGVYRCTPLVIKSLNGYLFMFKLIPSIEPTKQ